MKNLLLLLFCVTAALAFTSCEGAGSSGGSSASEPAIGDIESVSVGSNVNFNMIYASIAGSETFPTGTDDLGTATLTEPFLVAETELTCDVVAEVYQWAYDNGRITTDEDDRIYIGFDESDAEAIVYKRTDDSFEWLSCLYKNPTSATTECHVNFNISSDTFEVSPSGYEKFPFVMVSWYGAVQICNWLTEMRDGNTDNLVYSGIDYADWQFSETIADTANTGFRLPSEDEWEYAARYRGSDSVNTVAEFSNPCFTTGNSASGATAAVDPASTVPTDLVAVWDIGPNPDGPKFSQTKQPNALGLYDMSGNVSEMTFSQTWKVFRGGDYTSRYVADPWNNSYIILQNGYAPSSEPNFRGSSASNGLRLCRTME